MWLWLPYFLTPDAKNNTTIFVYTFKNGVLENDRYGNGRKHYRYRNTIHRVEFISITFLKNVPRKMDGKQKDRKSCHCLSSEKGRWRRKLTKGSRRNKERKRKNYCDTKESWDWSCKFREEKLPIIVVVAVATTGLSIN